MTLKIFGPTCALLALVTAGSFEASRKLEKLGDSFRASEDADFSDADWHNPSAEALGQMLRIASAGKMTEAGAESIGERMRERHHGDEEWLRGFMQGFHRRPAREVN
jgi:hypothetical protein